jgi:hypothetical protein
LKAPACFNHPRYPSGKRKKGRPCGGRMDPVTIDEKLAGWRCSRCGFVASIAALHRRARSRASRPGPSRELVDTRQLRLL